MGAPLLNRILVPLDGSELGDRILVHVRRILHRADVHVTLLHVAPDRESGSDGSHVERLRDELRIQGAQASSRVAVGDPASKILEVAEELRPSLIAMATHGRSGMARFARGSVAERVLSASPSPLLLVNPFAIDETEEAKIRKILVPLDGSKLSAEVLPIAAEVAQLFGSELVLFHSIELAGADFPAIAVAMTPGGAEALLRGQIDRVEGVPIRARVSRGMAAGTILDAAKEEHADLIALTSHGGSGASRWPFGSVAEKVLRHAPCPILALRTSRIAEPGTPGRRAAAGRPREPSELESLGGFAALLRY
jgi:nucleotide-binding universal stress UspA family protein